MSLTCTDVNSIQQETVHELKTWSEYFKEVWSGSKAFEIRKNDRDFKVGDIIILKEGDLGGFGMTDYDLTFIYTGREIKCRVKYILDQPNYKPEALGLKQGYCIISVDLLSKIDQNAQASVATEAK